METYLPNMKSSFLILCAVGACFHAASTPAFAQNSQTNPIAISLTQAATATNYFSGNTATNPQPRDANWLKRHEGFLEITKAGKIDLLFIGDSITDGWRSGGRNVWNKFYAPRHAANFGIGGDRTQHVLWRIDNGELDGLKPKAVVLMIGTNNTGKEDKSDKFRNATPEIIEGVTRIVLDIRARLPDSKLLLLAIFPRGEKNNPVRAQISAINHSLAKLDDGKMVKFMDIGSQFLEADGTLSRNIMPDLLHPNERGYEIWAEAIEVPLSQMLK